MKIYFSKLKKYSLKNGNPKNILYFLLRNREIVYIGITCKLEIRISMHRANSSHVVRKKFDEVYYCDFIHEEEIELLEMYLINIFNPEYNKLKKWKQITMKEKSNLINKYFPQ